MRTLHVAALPFPSPQGTQGLLHAMLEALSEAGHETHLACYAHGQGAVSAPYTIHRAPAASFTRSLRSGPSLDKLWLDASLLSHLAKLYGRLEPELVVAHHVEAALCALALGFDRLLFVAHTSLREELATYLPRPLGPLARTLGGACDALLARRAARTLAVSPLLAELLASDSARPAHALVLPWRVGHPAHSGECSEARARLGFAPPHEVVLYAGNLDRYQGLDTLLPELAHACAQRPQLRWLVATESPRARFAQAIRRCGLAERVRYTGLGCEAHRRMAHAAADLALVPRQSAGGLPIKLLDAMAREVPVIAAEAALSGLPLAALCEVVASGKGGWSRALGDTLGSLESARARARCARAYVEREHAPERFVQALIEHARALDPPC